MREMYCGTISKRKKRVEYPTAKQCYGCSKFFTQKKPFKNHIKTCRSMPGIVHKFNNQNISTFEDNYRFMGDLPFAIYFDIKTTCGKKAYNFEEGVELYPASYSIVVAFHTDLCIKRTFIHRSFAHMFKQLNSIAYLTAEMLHYFDPINEKQLRDCAKNVFEKREKFSVSEMFSCELKFVMEICKKWFAKKIGGRFRELYLFTKQKYRRENSIKWDETKYSI